MPGRWVVNGCGVNVEKGTLLRSRLRNFGWCLIQTVYEFDQVDRIDAVDERTMHESLCVSDKNEDSLSVQK